MESGSRIFIQSDEGELASPDARLVNAARRIERRALAFRRNELNDETVAIELLETVVAAAARRPNCCEIRNPEAYLWQSFRHLLNRELEMRACFIAVEDEKLERWAGSGWGSVADMERHILIREILDRMPCELREISSALLIGFTEEEIAEQKGITASAVANRLSRRMRDFILRLSRGGGRR